MCGICGIYSFDDQFRIDKSILKKMNDAIKYRGPDDEGIYIDDDVGLAVNRLSIIDIEGGHQPIHNEDGSIWVIFNGMIYNYKELRRTLEARNHRFYTSSDTEVIVHSYEEFGENCVKEFNGMFAFAVWDAVKKRLLLARDRIGIKPLHYTMIDNRLIFGSEIKSILQDPSVSREVDLASLHHFLGYEYVPAPRTMFKGIKKLLPGHTLKVEGSKISIKKYWDLNFKNCNTDILDHSDKIFELLKRSVGNRLISDVPFGALLSGGIDSSVIVGLMSKLLDYPIKTFSIGFADQSYNELEYARLVAEHFETEHYEEFMEPDTVNLANKIIQHHDEPFADVSSFPTYLVYELAKKKVKVVLSGDGGDELFAGYHRYLASRLDEYYSILPYFVRMGIKKIVEFLPPSQSKKGIVNESKRFIYGSSLPIKGRHVRWQYFITKKEMEELYSESMYNLIDLDSFNLVDKFYKKKEIHDKLSREQYVDIKMYLPDDILTKVDRMSMANSIEARVPFLDHHLVEFSAKVPHFLRLKGLTTKYILKKAMSRLLPKKIIKRKKQGFSIPMKNWLRCELKDMVFDVLSKEKIKEKKYFNYDYVEKIVEQHLTGRRDNAHRIWPLITFELWHDSYIQQ